MKSVVFCLFKMNVKIKSGGWMQYEARKEIHYAACAAVGVFISITLSRSPLISS
jgi:hypothetical protein